MRKSCNPFYIQNVLQIFSHFNPLGIDVIHLFTFFVAICLLSFRFGRKRPLFSQTSNHLLGETPQKNDAPKKGSNSVQDIIQTPIAEEDESESEDDLFGTPKANNSNLLKMVNPDGEVEITRIEESPISSGDAPISNGDTLNTTDEIVR